MKTCTWLHSKKTGLLTLGIEQWVSVMPNVGITWVSPLVILVNWSGMWPGWWDCYKVYK